MLRTNGKGLLKLALVFQGDVKAPGSWSGVPAGLYAGLVAAGAEVAAVDATAPLLAAAFTALGMAWTARTTNPVLAEAGGGRASLSMLRRHFDGAIAIGSGYELRGSTRTVTFEDMTVAQALAQPKSVYAELGERAARRWCDRQRRIYERSAACCVTSEWAASSIREDYGIDPAKVHVVGMGHNVPAQEVERDWEAPRFLFVGVDWERKRGAAVLAAFAEVIERFPSARLDLVGGNPPIEQAGVTGHGLLSLGDPEGSAKLAALLRESTCLVMPSSFEPFGIAHLDAGAAGVPSIGTTNGGAATAIGDGGVLVDPGDDAALVEAMLGLCDPRTARRLGARAREHARHYTWQAVAERIIAALAVNEPDDRMRRPAMIQ
jgi:glycosyltransferase involved in cell wall biosynthesis